MHSSFLGESFTGDEDSTMYLRIKIEKRKHVGREECFEANLTRFAFLVTWCEIIENP